MSTRALLIEPYFEYCTTWNKRSMALAFETSILLYDTCCERQPCSVADLGSGWSSYVLRRYACEHPNVVVTSVDDDEQWLKRTAEFLTKRDLPTSGLVSWSDYLNDSDVRHDVICHDFARGELRESAMRVAAARLNPGGVIIFDDAQHGEHRAAMRATCSEFGLTEIDIRTQTIDAIGRFAHMAVRR